MNKRKKLLLLNGWRIKGFDPGRSGVPINSKDAGTSWLPSSVPGDVNADLITNKKMPDPHFDTQGRDCYWVTSKEWWYRNEFNAAGFAGSETELVFAAADGCAEVWLNGTCIGDMNNAFREHRFPVSGLLKDRGNVLLLRFFSLDQILGGPRIDELKGWLGRRAFIRKPQFSFGWDWALPLPSIGLSGRVWIESVPEYRFIDMSVKTFICGRTDFTFEVSAKSAEPQYEIRIRVKGPGADIRKVLKLNCRKSYTSIQIPDPRLWFPSGLGEQPLYSYAIDLAAGGGVIDSRSGRFGIRETEIDENPFETKYGSGMSFGLKVNGEAVFAKGANWIPLDLWPGRIKEEQYEFYLKKAKEANFNILRVWGGGIYENDLFYDLCDELGIMVWQDFMFASTGYPVDRLRDEIIREAEFQISRLHVHPSVVLWCGCNEDIFSWRHPDMQPEGTQTDSGVYSETEKGWEIDRLHDDPQIYSMILRGLVSKKSRGVPYIESSPQSYDDAGNIPNSGNCHISAWKYALFETDGKYREFRKHFEKVCSFNSEFCIQGPAALNTIKSFFAEENYWPPNEAWIYHIQRGHRRIPHFEQTMMIAGDTFGAIDSLETYVKHGQAVHLEMMRSEYESSRRDRPFCGGTMVWMYNDCWPTSNWSIIDYNRVPKPAYYSAKRACAPVLPIISERGGVIEFSFSNESRYPVSADIVLGQESINGEEKWKEAWTAEVKENSLQYIHQIRKEKLNLHDGDYLFIAASVDGEALNKSIYFPGGWLGVQWPPSPNFTVRSEAKKIENGEWNGTILIQSDAFARMCCLRYTENDARIEFDDNFFDVSPNSEYTLKFSSDREVVPEKITIDHWMSGNGP